MNYIKTKNYFDINKSYYQEFIDKINFRISKIKNQKILISGGSGFLGKWLIDNLLNFNDVYKINLEIINKLKKLLNMIEFFISKHLIQI